MGGRGVNYYEHHIGDYAEATAHLTFVEDAAYSRLIRKYYAIEKPLPPDMVATQRLVGARTKEEKDAVTAVLQEFFVLESDGWHNRRCDEELGEFIAGEPERKLKAANQAARLLKHRQERSKLFTDLAEAGQHPSFRISIEDLRALHRRYCKQSSNSVDTNSKRSIETLETELKRVPAVSLATGVETLATATHTHVPSPHSPDPSPHSPIASVSPEANASRGTSLIAQTARGNGLIDMGSNLTRSSEEIAAGGDAWREVTGADTKAMEAWIEHCASLGKPVTPMIRIAQAKELAGYGSASVQVAAVQHCIARGWKNLRRPEAPEFEPGGTGAPRAGARGSQAQERDERLTREAAELQALVEGRAVRGLLDFREPHAHESANAYGTALRLEEQDRRSRPATEVTDLVAGLAKAKSVGA